MFLKVFRRYVQKTNLGFDSGLRFPPMPRFASVRLNNNGPSIQPSGTNQRAEPKLSIILFVKLSICIRSGQLLDVDIAPADFATVGLQLYWTSLDQGFSFGEGCLSVPEIVQGSLVHDEFAVENNGYDGASHGNVKGIPFTQGLVCVNQWISPRRSGLSIVP